MGDYATLACRSGTVWLLTDIAEAKGRQTLYTQQSPQVLKALRETALVQSVESSNRIEGVVVEPARLRPLVLGNASPRNRSEEEIQGYRRALNLIHTGAGDLLITPDLLQRLHSTIQEGAGDAGQWKRVDNEIVEFRPGGPPVVRFRPVSAAQTPGAAENCVWPTATQSTRSMYRHCWLLPASHSISCVFIPSAMVTAVFRDS